MTCDWQLKRVTPNRYGVGMMKRNTPDIRNDTAIEAWFADAGIVVETVEHCPIATCERCRKTLVRAA